MASLFGNRADFAIEVGIEPGLKPPSAVWGHMCIWCRGIRLGDIHNLHCGLYGAYRGFFDLIANIDDLWADDFVGLDELATLNFLDGLLYGYHGDIKVIDERAVEECRKDWQVWGKFNFLTNWDELFNRYKAFIIKPPGGTIRILSRDFPEGILSLEVSVDGFTAVSQAFIDWFDKQALRLRGTDTISSTVI